MTKVRDLCLHSNVCWSGNGLSVVVKPSAVFCSNKALGFCFLAAMTTKAPWIKRGAINDEVLQCIYTSDQDMYPAPLSYERLKSWVKKCPELSLCLQAEVEGNGGFIPVGAVIVLPVLQKHWENLLAGKLQEVDIDSETMLAGGGDADIGLHIFHIERFEAFKPSEQLKHFAEFALEDAREIVGAKKQWNVLGYSGRIDKLPLGAAY